MQTFRTTILILLIPILVLTTIADLVEQDGFVLQNQQIITPQDDLSNQYDRHHPSPIIYNRLASGETALTVYSSSTDCRQSTSSLSPAMIFFLRAPPLS